MEQSQTSVAVGFEYARPGAGPERVYAPRGAMKEFFLSREGEQILGGGAGTGKSRACLEKMNLCAMKYPKSRHLILRKTRESLTNTALVTFEEWVLPEGKNGSENEICAGVKRSHRQSYHYPNGSEIVVGGLDNITKVMSSEYDLIYVQEAIEIEESDWTQLTTRLRNGRMPYQQIFGDTNPGPPTHWIKERANRGVLSLRETRHEENPVYFSDEGEWTEAGIKYMKVLDDLEGVHKDRFRYGLWVAAAGARWPYLDPKEHLFHFYERFPMGLPVDAKILLGVDFGYAAPYCALWMYVDSAGDVFVYREDYVRGIPADLQPRRIIQRTASNEKIAMVRMDSQMWQAQQGHMPGKTSVTIADFYVQELGSDERFGPVVKGYKGPRQHPLATLDKYLGRQNSHPNLYIEHSCKNLWKELTEAVWDEKGKEDIDEDKCEDHAITALYYSLHAHVVGRTKEDSVFMLSPDEVEEIRHQKRQLKILELGAQIATRINQDRSYARY